MTVTQTAAGDEHRAEATSSDDAEVQLKERDGGRYAFIAEHGRGGLGRVMRTRDKDLGREVAIKEILEPGGIAEARFVREAMITARLEHPGIVPVHDAGRWADGTPFYSMKLVSGRPLKTLISEASTVSDRLALLPHVLAVADAVAYAHSRDIIHRDLKPSNVIVGDFGETVVIDWGLAKHLDEDIDRAVVDAGPYRLAPNEDLTAVGQVLGTPAYMPPEQASGLPTTKTADVYAIGALLYHIVSGSPPYRGTSSAETLALLAAGPPPPIATRAPWASAEVVAIIEKAMRREPSQRYRDAMELADDLKKLLTGQLVAAHQYTARHLVARWARRHRALLVVAGAAFLGLSIFGVVSIRRILAEQHRAEMANQATSRALALEATARKDAEARNAALIVANAESKLAQDPTETLRWLKQAPDSKLAEASTHQLAMRAWAAGVSARVVQVSQRPVQTVVRLRGDYLATSQSRESIIIWSRDLRPLATFTTAATQPQLVATSEASVAFLSDDRHVVAVQVSSAGTTTSVTFDCGRPVAAFAFDKGAGALYCLAKDGSLGRAVSTAPTIFEQLRRDERIATAAGEMKFACFRATGNCALIVSTAERLSYVVPLEAKGSLVAVPLAQSTGAIAWHGSWYAAASNGALRDVRSPAVVQPDVAPSAALRCGVSSQDGARLLLGFSTGTLQLLSEHATRSFTLPIVPQNLVMAPSGDRVAVTGEDGRVIILNVQDGGWTELRGHTNRVRDAAFLGENDIATASDDGSLRLWTVSPVPTRIGQDYSTAIYAVASRGAHVAAFAVDNRVLVADAAEPGRWARLEHPSPVTTGAWDQAGRHFATACWDGLVRVWGVDSGLSQPPVVAKRHQGYALALAWDDSSTNLASSSSEGDVSIYHLQDGTMYDARVHHGRVNALVYLVGTKRFASAGADGQLCTFSPVGPGPCYALGEELVSMTLGAKRHEVIIGARSGHLYWWDGSSSQPEMIQNAGDSVRFRAAPDGPEFFTQDKAGTVHLFRDVSSAPGTEWAAPCVGDVLDAALSSHAGLVAVACRGGEIALWDFKGDRYSMLHESRGRPNGIEFSPDGSALRVAGADGVVRSFDLGEIFYVPRDPEHFRLWIGSQVLDNSSIKENR